MRTIPKTIFSLFLFLSITFGFSQEIILDTVRIANNLNSPWDIEWAGDSILFVTELAGTIQKINLKTGQKKQILALTDVAQEIQVGLMGMDVHPNFPDSAFVYATYTYYDPNFQILLRLVRLTYDQNLDTLTLDATLYENIPGAASGMGGRLLVTEAREIFLSVGELELQERAQDTSSLNGKTLRFDLSGGIPNDNPFAGSPVWTMGHRNPQGLTEGANGMIYGSEHGTFSDDELNLLEPTRNYGWPLATGFCDATNQMICNDLNMMEPLMVWTPNIAPGGIAYYDSPAIPEWENSILIANLVNQAITWVELSTDGLQAIQEITYLTNKIGRIRDIAISPDGDVFVITSNTDLFGTPAADDDQVYQLVKTGNVSIEKEINEPFTFIHLPDNHQINISLQPGKKSRTISVFSMNGQELFQRETIPSQQSINFTFDPGTPGVFLVRLNIEGTYYYRKIINY